MKTVWLSDYLRQQEVAHNASAEALLNALPERPGLLARLIGLFSPRARRHVRQTRWRRDELLERAADHAEEAEYWAKGRNGEDLLGEVLGKQLGDEYALLRNYTPPAPNHAGGDIDAALVGPLGVIVFEVKAWRGEYLARGYDWFYRARPFDDWEPARANPTRQALRNVERVKRTLQRAGLRSVQVRGVVAVASPDMRVYLKPPLGAFVFFACEDGADARELWRTFATKPLTPVERRRAYVALLPHLAAALK